MINQYKKYPGWSFSEDYFDAFELITSPKAIPSHFLAIAHSMGTWQALKASQDSNCQGLIILSGFTRFCGTSASREEKIMHTRLDRMIAGLTKNSATVIHEFRLSGGSESNAETEKSHNESECAKLSAELKELKNFDATNLAQQVKCPCLIIHGEQDRIAPVRRAQELANNIPHAQVETIPANHDLRYASKKVNKLIHEFLRGLD